MTGALRRASRIASTSSFVFCGRTIRRVSSVGLTIFAFGRSKRPYFKAELISTATLLSYLSPANLAASGSLHSLPAFCSRIAFGIRRHSDSECFGKARLLLMRFLFGFLPAASSAMSEWYCKQIAEHKHSLDRGSASLLPSLHSRPSCSLGSGGSVDCAQAAQW